MAALRRSVCALTCVLFVAPFAANAEESRRIEEIVVTAEKRQSTVSDTSISITAFGEDMIKDFGIQGADELVNFIPATTRDAYDIRIRGVGRNFRALGGDPGVATYYNGVYSEDFGIAASENGLYDVQRIEALRGPQGTLYGRNSIGGALNYITNKPTQEFEGELRTLYGSEGAREYYGILSGPIIEDKLAVRVVGVKRERDGSTEGLRGAEDINGIHDQNLSMSLQWNIADNWESNLRYNARSSDRTIGQSTVLNEGSSATRGVVNTSDYARGLRPVLPGTPGAQMFTNPGTGTVRYALPRRPGVDPASQNPNPAFGPGGVGYRVSSDLGDIHDAVATNGDNNEEFTQKAIQFDLTWDINDTTSLKYLGGWMDFDYTFDIDLDYTNGTFAQPRQTVLESVETSSHELQLLWQVGDNLQMTSGLYMFDSNRLQNYAFRDRESLGRYVNPTNYNGFAPFVAFAGPDHTRRGAAAPGTSTFGPWQGESSGAFYEYWNKVKTEALAVYTQGTYTFNEEWALTVGVRWANDDKDAFEERTGYFEANFAFLSPFVNGACDAAFGFDCGLVGLTDLAIANVFMGNATPTFDAANPIAPTCSLTAGNDCMTPLRLGGVPFSFADSAEGSDDWGDTSFRVNLDWTPNEDTLIYASITTGYRAGGYSLGIGDSRGPGAFGNIQPATYDQEEVTAGELGFKGTFRDGQLQVNASIYAYQYDDYQDRIEIFNTASGTALDQVQNADEAENFGIEVEFFWLATDALTLGGNMSYTKTEYTSDFIVLEDDSPAIPVSLFVATEYNEFVPIAGANPLAELNAIAVNLNGNQLKRIPEWKATLWGSYDFILDKGKLSAGFTYSYTGEYYDTGIERDLDEVPDRERIDVSLTWRDNVERWTVRAFVDNITDDTNIRGIGTATEANNWRQTGATLYPRFAGLDVTYRWGAF
ncbi:MAG: iron complex outermembrane receptor protein [Candidatus Azotimanducaceae bacterium]|jgi:iron complex outermembrane receptor protein